MTKNGSWGTCCAWCGAKLTGDFPRSCLNGHITHAATGVVAVALVPVMVTLDRIGLLIIQRALPPVGAWALPGGYVEAETAEQAAFKELYEEVGFTHPDPSRFRVTHTRFAPPRQPDDDPRGLLLAFVTTAPVHIADLPASAPTSETQGWDVALWDQEKNHLTDRKGAAMILGFPLHHAAACEWFSQLAPTMPQNVLGGISR